MPNVGTVETGCSPFWRLIPNDTKTITIRRDPDECIQSLMKVGPFNLTTLKPHIYKLNSKLDQIEHRVPDVLSIDFNDLRSEDTCKQLFEHCLPYQHDPAWWQHLDSTNLQIDFAYMLRYFQAYQPQLNKLAKQAAHRIVANMARAPEIDGITIQEEPFAQFYKDGQKLFAEHLVQVDEAPDMAPNKNIELMQALEDIGCLQVMTARSNGRMFGYLMTVMGPSLESRDLKMATHTTFYRDASFKGLGTKLLKTSNDALVSKGVSEIHFRAGVRGSGPRLGSLYKRMGAEPNGEMYVLNVGNKP